jgi:hypothetical protein
MPTVNTLVGKQQSTFRLVSEETSIRWRQKVGDVTQTADQFLAGNILQLTSGVLKKPSGNASAGNQYGVAFETYTPALDECTPNGGLGTWLINSHVGQISPSVYVAGTEGANPGDKLYCNAGQFTSTAGGHPVAYVLRTLGDWIEYYWVGADMA